MLLSALQVHGRHEEIHQHTIGHNLPWDGQAAKQPDRLYNRFAENWENKKYTSHVLQFICSHLRFLTKMNLPGRKRLPFQHSKGWGPVSCIPFFSYVP